MNEKIKQYAQEVGISVEYLTNTKQWPLIEALSERIINECIDVANDTRYEGKVVANRIKFLFGMDQ